MKNVVKFGVALAVVACAAMGSAQDKKSHELSIRAGVFLPSQQPAIAVAKTWVSFGADLKLSNFAVNSNSYNGFYSVSVDFTQKNGWRSIPATLNYNVVDGKLTYFIGAGLAVTSNPTDASKFVPAATGGASIVLTHLAGRDIRLTGKYTVTGRSAYSGFGFFLGFNL